MNSFLNSAKRYASEMAYEIGEMAKELDGSGWAIVSAVLLVFGWFFLKGKKIRSS